jgi:hypothetical protein
VVSLADDEETTMTIIPIQKRSFINYKRNVEKDKTRTVGGSVGVLSDERIDR